MQFTKTFALSALAALAAAQDCQKSYDGKFQITVTNSTTATAKRDISKRASCGAGSGALVLTLQNGDLMDQDGRTGYVASNEQFQFDKPVQNGGKGQGTFSLCGMDLALGGSTTWYRCLSGNFYNLYDKTQGGQCEVVKISAMACDGSAPPAQSPASPTATVQATGSPAPTGAPAATQITDGQPQAPTGMISQLTDGQPQAPTPAAVSQITDGQPQAPTGTAPAIATGAASNLRMGAEVAAAIAGVAAIAML